MINNYLNILSKAVNPLPIQLCDRCFPKIEEPWVVQNALGRFISWALSEMASDELAHVLHVY